MSTQAFGRTILLASLLGVAGGCASVPPLPRNPQGTSVPAGAFPLVQAGAPSGVIAASATQPAPPPAASPPDASHTEKHSFELSDLAPENVWKSVKKASGFGPDEKIARASFQEGDALFREKKYSEAAAKFKTAANRWPDSTLEENALFLKGESEFFSDQYSQAHDTYSGLLKKHENSRYLDTVAAREFAIGRYWEQMYRADPHWPITPNVFDRSRPWFDTFGNAIKTYENVRMYDPTGPLADDSVMATADAYFLKGEYESAAYNYDLLRKEYPDSQFQPQAHVLGLQSKLHVYQGKDYDGVPLEEAEQISRQALTQFGDQLGAEKQRVADTAKQIVEMKAERDWVMGQYYEKKRCYGAARYYYVNLIKTYPLTRHAERARARIAEIRDWPDVPPNHFKWLTDLFPSENN
jgi:outer membrane protein assembly factor BamD (BamD/ComL family)